ncbi:TRPM8 channel-associated factor homolog [Pelobates fuscus]|uniref:TRPM8 channel-associated factor homolog n=1 Tax=Pelobates fuscus TaxID=191477 RepID=UPI002FE4CD4A
MSATESYRALVKNIDTSDFTGTQVPCDLLLSGEKAFPVVVNTEGQTLIAASQYGKGRIVVLAHEAYVSSSNFTQFIDNAIEWLKPSKDSLVGVHEKFSSMVQSLASRGHAVESTYDFYTKYGVYCMHAYDDRQSSELIWALKAGHGLLIGGRAWYWMTKNKLKNVLLDFPGNKVASVAGIQFLNNYGFKDMFAITPEIPTRPLIAKYVWNISEDGKQLMNGISELRIFDSGTPSNLLVHGERAFPLVIDESNKTYLAACYYGKGRVVVATHEDQISKSHQKQLITNVISWLDAGRDGIVGVQRDLYELQAHLHEHGFASKRSDFNTLFSVYCCTSYTNNYAQKLQEFVAEGGGLLIGGQAWYWASQNPGIDELINYPGNNIINHFGISIIAGIDASYKRKKIHFENLNEKYQCRRALSQLQNALDNNQMIHAPLSSWIVKLAEDCAILLSIGENDSQTFHSLKKTLVNLLLKFGIPEVSNDRRVKRGSKEAFLLRVAAGLRNTLPNFENLAAKLVPTPITLPVTSHGSLEINGTNKGNGAWRSTGFYVPPGKIAKVNFPAAAVNMGLEVQVGCHSDDLSNLPELKRPPFVTQRYAVTQTTLQVSNIFGGLLYVIIPKGCNLGQIMISIEEAVLAPYFKHGETTQDSWVETIRHYPSPWAEFESENIIFTVPSDVVISLMNPSEPLLLWERIMTAVFELSGLPSQSDRPERFVADVQITDGWMHSGYPIMCHLESAKVFLDYNDLCKVTWGATHELGHNQQLSEWELPPHTDEAMCNLWAIYTHENVLGILRAAAHFELEPQNREQRIEKHMERGAPLEEWTEWLCLETYLQLQESFGWGPYIKLFSDYQNMVGIKDENIFKMNLWAELFSQEVKKNLVPFFKTWNWPIDEQTSKILSLLPEWDENPMKKYIV